MVSKNEHHSYSKEHVHLFIHKTNSVQYNLIRYKGTWYDLFIFDFQNESGK